MQTSFLCQNIFPYEIQGKNDIECYDKVMDLYPDYPKIWWYNFILGYKQKIKEYFCSSKWFYNYNNKEINCEDVKVKECYSC
jgi:hypothetical protein